MQQINYDDKNGEIVISDQLDPTLDFSLVNQQQTIITTHLENVIKFDHFYDVTSNETDARYLERWWRASIDAGLNYSDWYQITAKRDEEMITISTTSSTVQWRKSTYDFVDFPCLDTSAKLSLEIKWIRKGTAMSGIISINEYNITGEIERNETSEATVALTPNQSIIFNPPYVYKVFSFDDIELISSNNDSISIQWRYSQDNKRTWTQWEPFNRDNLISARINPIRFFEVEYQFTNTSTSNVAIYDFNIIGDFQNVTNDYYKTNLFGIRDNAKSIIASFSNTPNASDLPPTDGGMLNTNNCGPLSDLIKPMTEAQKSQLFKPYALNQAVDLLNVLNDQASALFGWDVVYFATDADSNGIDHTFHEYQLLNVACDGVVKISVDQNNFPDNQIVMNQFDLSLFDTFEVHITKKNFKTIFGEQRRPSKDDFLYFPELNRMFRVEHAQPFRQFNNAAVYYKVMLKKYNQLANLQMEGTIADKVKELTKNSTIDELFGLEATNDIKDVANKDQQRTLTRDVIRHKIYAKINKELIENSTLIVSKSNYDMTSVTYDTPAVVYSLGDSQLEKGDNRAVMIWFNLNNYVVNETYNFINNYDVTNNLGYKISLEADKVNFTINATTSHFNLTTATISNAVALSEDVWYCYLANLDQRQQKLTQYIYKRDVTNESDAGNLGSSKLKLVYKQDDVIVPQEFLLENIDVSILGSDSKMTNLRVFNDIIAEDTHTKVLNQYIIRDTSALIFGDSANTTLILPKFDL